MNQLKGINQPHKNKMKYKAMSYMAALAAFVVSAKAYDVPMDHDVPTSLSSMYPVRREVIVVRDREPETAYTSMMRNYHDGIWNTTKPTQTIIIYR